MLKKCLFSIIMVVAFFAGSIYSQSDAGKTVKDLLATAGISQGVCSLLSLCDNKIAPELLKESSFFLHVLESSKNRAALFQKELDHDGQYGTRVVVEHSSLDALPYADNMVDLVLLVYSSNGKNHSSLLNDLGVSMNELLRVVHPGGKVIFMNLAKRENRGASLFQTTKKAPKGTDEWSHWEHGPDNNPISTDSVIKAPYRSQWLGGPLYTSMPAITTSAGGRLFTALGHIAHHVREERWLNTLIARNAYNGSPLWSRKLPDGYLVHRSAFIAGNNVFYMIENDGCLQLDPATGREKGRITIPEISGEWKYIALVDGILYLLAGDKKDPSETTIVRSKYSHWSWGELSDGYYQKQIPWGFGKTVAAYDVKNRKTLWLHKEDNKIDSRSLSIGGGRIFFYCPGKCTCCVDTQTGTCVWRNDNQEVIRLIEQPGRGLGSTPGFKTTCYSLYTPKALFFQAQTRMNVVAISAANGDLLWTRKKTTNNPNMLFADNNLLVGIGNNGNTLRVDPMTGKTIEDLGFRKRSCARLTATPDSFFCRGWPEGLTRYDRNSKKVLFNGALRPACNDGVIAANGLIYIGPWLCDCNLSLMGTSGLCSAGDFNVEDEDPVAMRLKTFTNNKPTSSFPDVTSDDWATYRKNNSRSASTRVPVSADPKRTWIYRPQASFRPTHPVSVDKYIFVCGDDGKVRQLDAANGTERWCFKTAGPISQPPSIWKGRAYVGSGDGWIYALDAATGKALWRFRAAPKERRIMMYDRLCSTWPVAAGVLVDDGIAYAAAGIIDYDGTYVCALDAETGQPKWRNTTSGHINRELRKGVSVQGNLTVLGNRLWMPGGNVISPASYSLQNGKCLSRQVGNGSPKVNRGEEIGVLKDNYLIFGGRLKYSAVKNYVNPGAFTIAKAGPDGISKALHLGFGKIPPAWSEELFVMATGQGSTPVCIDIPALEAFVEKAGAMNYQQQMRYANTLKKRWTANEFRSSDTISFAITKNAVLTVSEIKQRRSRFSNWMLSGLDRKTGRTLWQKRLNAEAFPGGLMVTRDGLIVVLHLNGSISCFK